MKNVLLVPEEALERHCENSYPGTRADMNMNYIESTQCHSTAWVGMVEYAHVYGHVHILGMV